MIYRPIKLDDLNQLEIFSRALGRGTSGAFQTGRSRLEEIILQSMESFSNPVKTPGKEAYVFVLHNEEEEELIGIYKVVALVNGGRKFFSYQVKDVRQHSPILGIDKSLSALFLKDNLTGCSLPSSQVIHPKYRGKWKFAHVLCTAIGLYFGAFPQRFPERIIGEYRGNYDENGNSLFWKNFIKFFVKGMNYKEYLQILDKGLESEIISLLPSGPIFTDLLPSSVKEIIGQTHPEARPAFKLNIRNGMKNTGHISYSSGAPILEAPFSKIASFTTSTVVKKIEKNFESKKFLISNSQSGLGFRVCYAPLLSHPDRTVTINSSTANALNVTIGSKVYYGRQFQERKNH